MYENGDVVDAELMDEDEPITSEDAWTVISSHFEERGLVGQQLDSYDVFMTIQMQVSFLSPNTSVG